MKVITRLRDRFFPPHLPVPAGIYPKHRRRSRISPTGCTCASNRTAGDC